MIKLLNLSKYYYSGNTVALGLRKVNLEFGEKEFAVITGESGSGKTTLLSTISGLLPYEEGELYVEGKPTSHFDEEDWENYRREYIAFVFQNYNLIDSYTVLENVMAVLLIQGVDKAHARKTALEYLAKVGLTDYLTHHASELSSGQKQRLSIARALAKNTRIIVADEPTGNLDAENGKQVMELLSNLAKDRLVLVVTHNYEEAAPFATRKVRIYDGEIVEDILINRKDAQKNTEQKNASPQEKTAEGKAEAKHEEKAKNTRLSAKKISNIFTRLELRARKRKGVLFTSLLFFVSVATFLFFGNLLANLDDTSTRIYTNEAFLNIDERRIAIRHSDGAEITDADVEFFKQLEHVEGVEQYGLAGDINYFCEEGKDYIIYHNQTNGGMMDESDPKFDSTVYLKEYSKFVHSTSGLTQEDLAYGTLPQSVNDVVIYTDDPSLLGTTFTCFFSDARHWKMNSYCRLEMTICGILKEETTQYYFSEELARMFSVSSIEEFDTRYAMNYFYCYWDKDGNKYFGTSGGGNSWKEIIFYIDDNYQTGESYQFVFSEKLLEESSNISSLSIRWLMQGNERADGYHFMYSQGEVYPFGDANLLEGSCHIAPQAHQSTEEFICVSREVYAQITKSFYSAQASIYISDYAYLDDVMKKLFDEGYEAISPYRIGAVSYDPAKVSERLITLGLSLGGLVVLMVLEIFILRALLKNGKNDCVILKSIGMPQHILGKIQMKTLLCYYMVAYILMVITAFFLNRYIPQVHALVVYYRIHHWLILFGMNAGVVVFTAYLHNRYLKRLLLAGME